LRLDLILLGFGNVGRHFAGLIQEQRHRLERGYDLELRIVAVATRHGQLFSPRGIAPSATPLRRTEPVSDRVEFLRGALSRLNTSARAGRLVVIEITTLDIAGGEPAIAHVRAALAGGAHVVTANKGPAAFAYRSLQRAAARANRRFLFEGAVMDGIPIFNLVRETLPAVRIAGFRGIVNTTTNYILGAMERGESFDNALRNMQAQGFAEADASLDVEGWDAAAKTAALANVLLDANLTPHHVRRRGITKKMAERAVEALHAGRRLKLVAEARRRDGTVIARVAPQDLAGTDPLANVDGHQNALILDTDVLGEIAIVQRGSGLTQTAYALLSDLVTLARSLRGARATRQLQPQVQPDRSRRSSARRAR